MEISSRTANEKTKERWKLGGTKKMRQGVKKENGRDEIPRCVVEVKQRKKNRKKWAHNY